MNKILQIALTAAAFSIAAFFALGTYILWGARAIPLHINGVLTRAEGVESKANATLINLDKGTAAWAASSKDQAQSVQDVMTSVQGAVSGIDLTLASVRTDADAIHGAVNSISATADAATGTLTAATETIGEGKRTIASLQPLVASYTRSGDDLDALLKDEAIHRTLTNVADTTQNLNGIVADGRVVSDKLTKDFVTPKRWYQNIGPKLSDLWDYGALVARHTP